MSEVPAKRAKTAVECRACLTKLYDGSLCIDIFRPWNPAFFGMGLSIAEDLAKLTNIEINVFDALPKSICKKCCSKLQEAIKFTMYVQSNNSLLKERYKDSVVEKPLWPKPIQVDKNITCNELNEMTVEVKQEVLTEDECEANELTNEYNVLEEQSLDIKIEPEEITPSISIKVNGPYSLLPEHLEEKENGIIESLKESLHDDIKQEPMSEDEAEPSSDMPKDCMLCFKTFHTVKGLKAHVISVHSYDTVTSARTDRSNVCTTCNISFPTPTDLFVHQTCHSQFTCYVCDKKFESFHKLSQHRSKKCTKTSVLPRLKTLEDVRRPAFYIADKKSHNKQPSTETKHEPSSPTRNTIEINQASVTNQISEKLGPDITQEDEIKSNKQNAMMNSVEELLEEIHRETVKIPEKCNLDKKQANSTNKVNNDTPAISSQSNDFVKSNDVEEEKLNSHLTNGPEQDDIKIKQESDEFIEINIPKSSCHDDIIEKKSVDVTNLENENIESESQTEYKPEIVNTTQGVKSENVNSIQVKTVVKEQKFGPRINDKLHEDKSNSIYCNVTSISKESVQEATAENVSKNKMIEDILPTVKSSSNDEIFDNSVANDENDKNLENS